MCAPSSIERMACQHILESKQQREDSLCAGVWGLGGRLRLKCFAKEAKIAALASQQCHLVFFKKKEVEDEVEEAVEEVEVEK